MKELFNLIQQKEQIKALIKSLEEQLREIEEVLSMIKDENRVKEVFLLKGNIFLKINREDAIKQLEQKKELLKLQIERYNKRIEEINQRIKQLRSQ